ncbi:YdcF family protein [Candidatus Pelagibacter sp. HIMB1593]|uniref:YdcF family protein n=1 Tax=Candidatus Pelagibacter sp. HIMB1593 TaxID=3413355 RepID=UPI003F861CB6
MIVVFLLVLGIKFKSKKFTISGIIVLSICSLPIVSKNLINYLEINYKPIQASNMDKADAIIVLSGMLRPINTVDGYKYEFNDAVDRFVSGIDLYKNNKANFIVFTRGKYPWSIGKPGGEYLKELAISYGIPENKIMLTENVVNTDQEAKAVKKLFPQKNSKLILVTSASHMPRALKVFQAADLEVIEYPVDFKSISNNFTLMDLIPSVGGLGGTSYFVREIIGRIYYKIKYIK